MTKREKITSAADPLLDRKEPKPDYGTMPQDKSHASDKSAVVDLSRKEKPSLVDRLKSYFEETRAEVASRRKETGADERTSLTGGKSGSRR